MPLHGQRIAFVFASLGFCGVLALNACSSSSGKPDGGAGAGGTSSGGHGGGGGAGGVTTDGGAGTGGHGGAAGGDAGANLDAPVDAPTDGGLAIAWRAFLPLATASSEVDGGTMGTTNDTSGHAYNATFFGPAVTFSDASMNLAGMPTETVVIPAKGGSPVIDVSGSYSVSVWVTLKAVGGYQTVVGGEGYAISSFFLQKRGDNGNVFAFTVTGADAISAPPCLALATVSPVANQQYHLVATRDGTTGLSIIYVDGVESGRTTCPAGWTDTGIMGIGHGVFAGGRTDRVNGSIAELGLIDRVLTPAEVAAIHAAGRAGMAPGDGGADTGADTGTDSGAGGDGGANDAAVDAAGSTGDGSADAASQ